MHDEVLIELLEKGLNLHDENTNTFFGLKEGDEGFSQHRAVAKMIQFARLDEMASVNPVNSWKAEMPIMSQAS